ncbi:Unknown protein [Striga hermonthica]|uniref:DC1 domain-containing protein n=1 Tax=Striga hermonthica TaxID=68872 RepID=A0A9N7NH27_STRHE|nr:Unknown protein [Striga hermonthica]
MHKSCAQLPEHVNYPYSSERLTLNINPYLNNTCKRCGKLCANIIYTHDFWNILHPLCAAQVEIKIEHYSHNDHPLVALSRETMSLCDACGEKHEGFFFACRECNFWIHVDCALLPSIVNIPSHDHYLILTYACMSLNTTVCHLCLKGFHGKGMYLCAEKYDYYAHLRCVAANMGDFTPKGN